MSLTDHAHTAGEARPAASPAAGAAATSGSDGGTAGTAGTADFEALARTVDEAKAELVRLDQGDRALADDAIAAVEAFHRPVLVSIVQRLRDDPRGKELLFELVDDPHVRAVLALHGIIRTPPPPTEIIPEPEASSGTTAIIPLSAIGVRRGPSADGWHKGPSLDALAPGTLATMELRGPDGPIPAVVVHAGGTFTAFRNECPHQGMPLSDAILEGSQLTCAWHGFRFDATNGECLSAPGAQLEVFATKVADGAVWAKVP